MANESNAPPVVIDEATKEAFSRMFKSMQMSADRSAKPVLMKSKGVDSALVSCTIAKTNDLSALGGGGGGASDASAASAADGGGAGVGPDGSGTGKKVSYHVSAKFQVFNGVTPKKDQVIISPNSETILVKLEASSPAQLKKEKIEVSVPVSPITGRKINWIALNKGDMRMIFTNNENALRCPGDLCYVVGLTPTYSFRVPKPTAGTVVAVSKPADSLGATAAAAAAAAAPIVVAPATAIADKPAVASETRATSDVSAAAAAAAGATTGQLVVRQPSAGSVVPYVGLDPFFAKLGFHYSPTICSSLYNVDEATLKAYYSGDEKQMPLEAAMSLEVEHPEIIANPVAVERGMTPTVRWNCEMITRAIVGGKQTDLTILNSRLADDETMWFVHEALENANGDFGAAIKQMEGRKFLLVHRPTPIPAAGQQIQPNAIDAVKIGGVGPATIQRHEFGVLPTATSSFGEQQNPWLAKSQFNEKGEKSSTLVDTRRLAGICICQSWGPGVPYAPDKLKELKIYYATYNELIQRAFGITDNMVWNHLAPVLTENSVVSLECVLNPTKTLRIDTNHYEWSLVKTKFTMVADVLRLNVDLRKAMDVVGEEITVEAAADLLGTQTPSETYLQKLRREEQGKDLPPVSLLYNRTHAHLVAVAASVGCKFRVYAVKVNNKTFRYVFAVRPESAPAMAAGTKIERDPVEAANDELRNLLRTNMVNRGGFYQMNGLPIVVDNTNLAELCAARGVFAVPAATAAAAAADDDVPGKNPNKEPDEEKKVEGGEADEEEQWDRAEEEALQEIEAKKAKIAEKD